MRKEGSKYTFIILNTERLKKHWWSSLDFHLKKGNIFVNSTGLSGLKSCIIQEDKKQLVNLNS